MSTRIKHLDPDSEDYEILHSMCKTMFLHGGCHFFASALHCGLGWATVGLSNNKTLYHVLVRDDEGMFWDARGMLSKNELGSPFGISPPYTPEQIDLEKLGAEWQISGNGVNLAARMAEILWPDLPWKNSFASRLSKFADALEVLCKEHGLWIRSPVPASCPLIGESYGDEGGYEFVPSVDGRAYSFDRYF